MTRSFKTWFKVQVYQSKGKFYARLVYGCVGKPKIFRHIPGGAAASPLVKERRRLLKRAIASGANLQDLLKMLDRWRDGRGKP